MLETTQFEATSVARLRLSVDGAVENSCTTHANGDDVANDGHLLHHMHDQKWDVHKFRLRHQELEIILELKDISNMVAHGHSHEIASRDGSFEQSLEGLTSDLESCTDSENSVLAHLLGNVQNGTLHNHLVINCHFDASGSGCCGTMKDLHGTFRDISVHNRVSAIVKFFLCGDDFVHGCLLVCLHSANCSSDSKEILCGTLGECQGLGIGLDVGKEGGHDVCVCFTHRLHEEVVVSDGRVVVDSDVAEQLAEGDLVEGLSELDLFGLENVVARESLQAGGLDRGGEANSCENGKLHLA